MKGLNRRIITLLLLALGAISPVGSVYDAETNRMFTYVPYHFEAAEDGLELRGRFKPFYTGREYLDHPVVAREDTRRAEWMKDLFPRLLAIPGCEKVFLWVSMDEFEGGFSPDAFYGTLTEGQKVRQADLWGVIANRI